MNPTDDGSDIEPATQELSVVPGDQEEPGAQRENRVLAAIVFTDAVAFSKLAGKDEQAAFGILNRDFDLMRLACSSFGGRVLNTMGDGMLMCFSSAVDAMNCALRIQQQLFAQSQTIHPASVLQHRIGVHLGDIIIDGDNVFGDGVNVAARLQAECKPGAICYSRMVADVIKNKVPVRGRFLGPRMLKNIAEPVAVYEAPSLAEFTANQHDPGDPIEPQALDEGASGSKATLILVGSALLVIVAVVLIFTMTRPKQPGEGRGPAKPTPVASESSIPTPTNRATPPDKTEELANYKNRYDFQSMVSLLPAESQELTRVQSLVAMRSWFEAELGYSSLSKPILLNDGSKARIGTRGVIIEGPTGFSETPLESLPPATWLALLQGMLAAPPSGKSPPTESTTWTGNFSAEYNL